MSRHCGDNLGVPTYFTANIVNGRDYPVLQTSGGFKKRVTELLTWLEPHKQEAAQSLRPDRDTRLFPMHRQALIDRIRTLGMTQKYRNVLDPRTRTLFRSTAVLVASEIGLELSQEELSCDYVPVASVEYVGENEVFDIAVPETEAFVGNGIVNHNTINMPRESTVRDVYDAYVLAWKLGLKSVAIYRDGSKGVQPVTVNGYKPVPLDSRPEVRRANTEALKLLDETRAHLPTPHMTPRARRRLPDERPAVTHKFQVGGHEGLS